MKRSEDVGAHGILDLRQISEVVRAEMPVEVFNHERAATDYYMYKQLAQQHESLSMPAFGKILCTTFEDTYPDFALLLKFYRVVPRSTQNIIKTELRSRTTE